MIAWPVLVLLALLTAEGVLLVVMPEFVRAVLAEATPATLQIAGIVEILVVLIVLYTLYAG